MADEGPAFGPLQTALEAIRHLIHGFLQKKREKEPDPVEVVPQPRRLRRLPREVPAEAEAPVRTGVLISLDTSSEPADRVDAIRKVAEAAAFLRRREPESPASYLMLRGLRWGELRAAIDLADPTRLEAPPTELRRHLKKLLLDKKYEELLEAAESAMALPCSRAWLDLQRFVVEACDALGSGYEAIARAIRSELKALVTDIPQLLDATLMDETPAANAETRAWLVSLSQGPSEPAAPAAEAAAAVPRQVPTVWDRDGRDSRPTRMPRLCKPCARARSGRRSKSCSRTSRASGRDGSGSAAGCNWSRSAPPPTRQTSRSPSWTIWRRRSRLHKLDDWEDPGVVAGALATIMKMSIKVQADKAQQQKLFERICRLDPAQAFGDGK